MARWVKVPVRVGWDGAGCASRLWIAGKGRPALVEQCLERWRESGEWWNGETEREVQRLLLLDGAVVEVSGPLHESAGIDDTNKKRNADAGKAAWRLDTWFD